MRSILVAALVFMLAFVPAAQAQQVVVPAAAEPVPSSLVELAPHWSQPDTAGVRAAVADSRFESGAAEMREPTARTLLAVVGAAVLVIALIALFR